MEAGEFNGTVWKLGTNWKRAANRNFFSLLKARQIVIGLSDKLYSPGDIIGIFDGIRLLAVTRITQPPVSVKTDPALKEDLEAYGIDFEEEVNFTPVKIYEVADEDSVIYKEQRGIVRIHHEIVTWQLVSLYKKYSNETLNQSLKLYKDAPAVIDHLGRTPFVEAIRKYIDRLWEGEKDDDSFTIHINGEWGSGKSTVLNLLKANLEKSGTDEWVVVSFNAWQYQHIQVPWWVFLDSVFRSILLHERFPNRWMVFLKEYSWRIFAVNKAKWYAFSGFLLILILTLPFGSGFWNFDALFSGTGGANKIGAVVSLVSLIGTIGAFIYAIVNSLLPGSEDAAMNFQKNVRDPMRKIKKHYTSIIKYTRKNVAIFIDDIDRCNPAFVVGLLEGLQTLFRTGRVLYVIAGDASWIRESFEIHYGEMKKVIRKPGQSLGNFFVEKTLQQSISLPQVTPELKKAFWNMLLEGESVPVDENNIAASAQKINEAQNDEQLNEIIRDADSDLEKTILRQKAAEKVISAENLENIEHSLLKYYELLEPNPRSMKRLVNSLALEKAANYLSGLNEIIDEDHLVKWAILKSRFPLIANDIRQDQNKFREYQNEDAYPEIAPLLKDLDADQFFKLIPG